MDKNENNVVCSKLQRQTFVLPTNVLLELLLVKDLADLGRSILQYAEYITSKPGGVMGTFEGGKFVE